MSHASTLTTVLFDVDGTLVDSNDAHAHAWVRAFAEHDIAVSFDDIRRLIGMGGDKLMPKVSGIEEDSAGGERIAERRAAIFTSEYLPSLEAFPGAGQLVAAVKARGFMTVAASSARRGELEPLLEVAGARHAMDRLTSSDDAESSKPDPDIIMAALQAAGAAPGQAVMIGDTPYDIEAASRAGVPTIAFRCGGWPDDDLRGAIAVYDDAADLLARLDSSPLGATPVDAARISPISLAVGVQHALDARR